MFEALLAKAVDNMVTIWPTSSLVTSLARSRLRTAAPLPMTTMVGQIGQSHRRFQQYAGVRETWLDFQS
jgi:hypothetical protein